MNPQGEIYSALSDAIPPEDKARLDGYLRGRDEACVLDGRAARIADMEAELEELRATYKR